MPQGAVMQAAGTVAHVGRLVGRSAVPPPVPPKPACGRRSARWNRDEWDVALTSGTVCRIYQDRTTERWFLEGIYD